jgi:S-adenosylmethionine:tRNA ribosyltransferase-isomerase
MASTAINSGPAPGSASAGPAAEPQREQFEFELPAELIAQHPAPTREGARLLQVGSDAAGVHLRDGKIPDLLTAFEPGDVLVINDTRVIKARLHGEKSSGGRVEILLERALSAHRALVMLRTSHPLRPGTPLRFFSAGAPDKQRGPIYAASLVGRQGDLFELEFARPLDEVLEAAGEVPLPPYIRHAPAAEDAARYQTVYAREPGAVAAPTAGLHLSTTLLADLQERGVQLATITLHVGAGTFQPVRAERLRDHRMHSERYRVPAQTAERINAARAAGRRIIAVGTTSVRALESSARDGQVQAGEGETRLFILPGFEFRIVDRLLTNFHLPGSTLLMLVAAFAGTEAIRAAYRHAVEERYRFFSYGDAMLLERGAGH